MWKNTVAIHSILKEKKLQNEIFNQLNIKKVQLTKIILRKKKQEKKESTIGKKTKVIHCEWRKNKRKKKCKKKKVIHCVLLL